MIRALRNPSRQVYFSLVWKCDCGQVFVRRRQVSCSSGWWHGFVAMQEVHSRDVVLRIALEETRWAG